MLHRSWKLPNRFLCCPYPSDNRFLLPIGRIGPCIRSWLWCLRKSYPYWFVPKRYNLLRFHQSIGLPTDTSHLSDSGIRRIYRTRGPVSDWLWILIRHSVAHKCLWLPVPDRGMDCKSPIGGNHSTVCLRLLWRIVRNCRRTHIELLRPERHVLLFHFRKRGLRWLRHVLSNCHHSIRSRDSDQALYGSWKYSLSGLYFLSVRSRRSDCSSQIR